MGLSDQPAKSLVVGDRLREWAEYDGSRNFVRCESDWLTYGEVMEQSDRVAAGLQSLGVERGDRVGLILGNRLEYVNLLFAIAKIGAIQVPLNTFLRGDFLTHQLSESKVSTVISDAPGLTQLAATVHELPDLSSIIDVDGLPEGLEFPESRIRWTPYDEVASSSASLKPAQLNPSDICSILYTSGTTGMPKGCIMGHGYYLTIPRIFREAGWFEAGDTLLTAMKLFHTSGQVLGLMTGLEAGAPVAVEPEFHASTLLSRANEVGATVIYGVGAVAMLLLAQPERSTDRQHNVKRGKFIPMTPENQVRFKERFGIDVMCEAYGLTECVPVTMTPLHGPRKETTAGRVVSHLEIRTVDGDDVAVPPGEVGEVVIRPREQHVMFQGYWNNPEATLRSYRNLWYHTGDSGILDGDGFLTFADRKTDSLRRRGENVSSFELEHAIARHPGIARVAVIPVPSPMTEDDIKACIVPEAEAKLSPDGLFEFFKRSLPYYAIPRYVEIVEGLPVNAMQRVQKFKLRERPLNENTWDLEAMGLAVTGKERRGASGSVAKSDI